MQLPKDADRFVPMAELVFRLGLTRAAIYKLPDFKLVRMKTKAGALESEVMRFLASLPPPRRRPGEPARGGRRREVAA